jgi:inorganic triphosphatase YgiF
MNIAYAPPPASAKTTAAVRAEPDVGAAREIELKFLCAPADLGAVLAAAPAGQDEVRELISVYFDTPDRRLEKAGVSLRVRQSQGHRVLTMKRGDGLAREEYEAPLEGEAPPTELAPLREVLSQAQAAALAPAFDVRVTRRQRLVRFEGAEIELALDQGEVCGGRRTAPICEVELELKRGDPTALFALARQLARAAPLHLSFDTKSARGQALVAGEAVAARRGRVRFARDATAAEAFQAIARDALGAIATHAAALRDEPGPEAVHGLRVAARRLRSALATFRPVVQDDVRAAIKAELRWLAGALDEARDLDVFAAAVAAAAGTVEPPPAGLAALSASLAAACAAARRRAAESVSCTRFRLLMIETAAWVETGAWLSRPAAGEPARRFAARALTARRRKLLEAGRKLVSVDAERRHALRIQAKTLRYAAEGFADLFGRKAAARYAVRAEALQSALGALNDIAAAEALVAGLDLTREAAFAAGELAGLRAAKTPKLLAKAAKALKRLEDAEPFWA